MSRQAPYLQRRGDSFSFRMAVPASLHGIIGGEEFMHPLRTGLPIVVHRAQPGRSLPLR